ncbi:MFS transporter [Acidipila rosea]|uniref:Sugar phosphate permease n=1 Tax=Acidipila rosea TaxID=768535 RepID=A0A4R1L1A4_9BACT|nr:MFS transporter [Acidipila rosea]TCK71728.1 sugar phosphate permease [Acidipila rosea]
MAKQANPADQAIALAKRRLVPFLLLMYVVSFLDRANIGFAKEALHASAGISDASFALGAGLFFLTYALFEIPSNLIMHRVGARVWMCRIMVSWGLISMATMFVTGQTSFYVLRLLLGAAEAGFFPGIILYLSYWFPNRTKGQILGLFYFGAPLAFIFGGPLSGLLLELPSATGLFGWQWMFLVEGFLAVLVGVWAYRYLGNRPAEVLWLTDEQKMALQSELSGEEQQRRSHGAAAFPAALADTRLLYFMLLYFLIQMSVYGVVFYLPTEVGAILGRKVGIEVGFVSAIPWLCAMAATYWIPRAADRHKNHRLLAILTLFISGLASLAFPASTPTLAMIALCLAASGFIAVQPLFWTFPMTYLADSAAAGGLASINAMGAVGGFVAPNAKVWADRHFGSPHAGAYLLAAFTLLTAVLLVGVRQQKPPAQRQSQG